MATATSVSPARTSPVRQWIVRILATLLVLWLIFAGVVTWSMYQPPEKFARVMSYLPVPIAFVLYPFETVWLRARAGHLQPGDPAPDFNLATLDKTAHVQLSSLTANKPVVLIFGSYT